MLEKGMPEAAAAGWQGGGGGPCDCLLEAGLGVTAGKALN